MGKRSDFGYRRIGINMIFSTLSFALSVFISFFITPYITANLGAEAYGFVKLANDFVSYASLASIALNSMASRFIMLERERGNREEAEKYYSSITIANILLSLALMIPSTICVLFIEKWINIPSYLVIEVKVTFAITLSTFLLSLASSTFGNCYYLTNRLDISSIRAMQANIVRVCVVILLFYLFTPKISYLAAGGFASTIFVVATNIYYHRKLTPDLKFDSKKFKFALIREVLSTGVWNSITRLSQIFSSGLDLLVTNLFIGSIEMGYLSIAKTVPNLITSFNSTISNAFNPNMMKLYAEGNMEQLKQTSKTAMKFMCLFVTVPTAILIGMGEDFFSLWVPEQPARLLNILSILTVVNSCITGPMQPLYQIFTISNKVKENSIVMIVYGFLSILVTYITLKTTSLGLYAVAGVSLVGSVVVAIFYHMPFSAIYIGLPWYTFLPEIFKSCVSLAVQSGVVMGMHMIVGKNTSWMSWLMTAAIAGLFGVFINALLILSNAEKKQLLNLLVKRIRGVKI